MAFPIHRRTQMRFCHRFDVVFVFVNAIAISSQSAAVAGAVSSVFRIVSLSPAHEHCAHPHTHTNTKTREVSFFLQPAQFFENCIVPLSIATSTWCGRG